MNLVVVLEYRFDRTPDGAVWTQTTFPYSFWCKYLSVFDTVRIVARVKSVETVPDDWKRVDGNNVKLHAVPYYIGPWQYLQQAHRIKQIVSSAVQPGDAVLLRSPSQLANCLEPWLRQHHYPYAVQVVSDPYDVFAPGAVSHPLRSLFRWWFVRRLQQQCQQAQVTAYVTSEALQRRYPPASGRFTTCFSDVALDDYSQPLPTRIYPNNRVFTLVTVASLAQRYKGIDVLITAIAQCVEAGWDLRLKIIGDGKHRSELEAQAQALELGDRVQFLGQLAAGQAVCEQLDQAHLFVLPSRHEGLPRAMVEAMARGLPCIGSAIGGIPELLSADHLVPPNDPKALAQKIQVVLRDPDRLTQMSTENLEAANCYSNVVTEKRAAAFYQKIRDSTKLKLKSIEKELCTFILDDFN